MERWRTWFKGGALALDVCLLGISLLVAYQTRALHFPTTLIYGDWEPFLRGTNDMAFGFPMVAEASPFYTSVPLVFFAGLIRLLGDPDRVFQAWYAIGALASPCLYLAIRPFGGPLAALAGALILALAPADVHVVIGVKSPYIISLFSALGALGLSASILRRPWGPPLMVAGLGGAVGCHSGLWLQSIAGSLLAMAFALRLRGKARWSALASLVVIGLGYVAVVYLRDLNHLRYDIEMFRRLGPPPAQGGGVSVQQNALEGLSLAYGFLKPLGYVLVASILAMIPQGLWVYWRRERVGAVSEESPSDSLSPYLGVESEARHRLAMAAGLLGFTLAALGGAHYARLATGANYLEVHHLVGLVPWLAYVLGTLPTSIAIPRVRISHMIVPTLVLGVWLEDVDLQASALEGRVRAVTESGRRHGRPGFLLYSDWEAVAKPIRAQAKGLNRQPMVYSWLGKSLGERGSLSVQIVNELARMGWPADVLDPGCYLITAPEDWDSDALSLYIEGPGVRVWSYPDCAELKAEAETLCDETGPNRLRRRRAYGGQDLPGQILPCAVWDETLYQFSGPEAVRDAPPPPPPIPGGLPQREPPPRAQVPPNP